MISKADLKSYEFESMDQYFDYILDSHINGQFKQVSELVKDLSRRQKVEFTQYLRDLDPTDSVDYCYSVVSDCLKG